jgi:hypothetical protein
LIPTTGGACAALGDNAVSFGSPSPPPVQPLPPPPSTNDQAAQSARAAELAAQAKAKGRAATLLTGGRGDTSTPNLGKTNILGG